MRGSLPCTPWSTWNYINSKKLGHKFRMKLLAPRTKSLLMLKYFAVLAREVIANGGDISFERPRFCTGWNLETLTNLISKFEFPYRNWIVTLCHL